MTKRLLTELFPRFVKKSQTQHLAKGPFGEGLLEKQGKRVYLKPGEQAPEGANVQTGARGGKFYDTPGGGGAAAEQPQEAVPYSQQEYEERQAAGDFEEPYPSEVGMKPGEGGFGPSDEMDAEVDALNQPKIEFENVLEEHKEDLKQAQEMALWSNSLSPLEREEGLAEAESWRKPPDEKNLDGGFDDRKRTTPLDYGDPNEPMTPEQEEAARPREFPFQQGERGKVAREQIAENDEAWAKHQSGEMIEY